MPLLPYLGNTDDTENWSSLQIYSFAICTYLILFIFMIAIFISLDNLGKFMKSSEARPHPLFFFYIWIFLDLGSNAVWLLYNVKVADNDSDLMLVLFLPATFRAMLGIEQIWLMIELIVRMNLSKSMLENPESSISEYINRQRRCVTIGRVAVNVINIIFVISICAVCLSIRSKDSDLSKKKIQALSVCFDSLFAVLFCALTIVVLVLIRKLRVNNRALLPNPNSKDGNYFRIEINTLSFILIFFAISYLLRVVYDSIEGFEESGHKYYIYIAGLICCIPFDLLPVFIVLCFHRRNLKQVKNWTFLTSIETDLESP